MSAWIVNKAHIDAMVTAAQFCGRDYGSFYYWHERDAHYVTFETEDDVGQMLWSENVASVSYRYNGDTDLPGPIPTPDPTSYEFTRSRPFSPVEMLSAIDCYEYQSCEHPGWKDSQAHAFCQALRHQMIGCLPGYDEAPWGISDREVNA